MGGETWQNDETHHVKIYFRLGLKSGSLVKFGYLFRLRLDLR